MSMIKVRGSAYARLQAWLLLREDRLLMSPANSPLTGLEQAVWLLAQTCCVIFVVSDSQVTPVCMPACALCLCAVHSNPTIVLPVFSFAGWQGAGG
jgi:hypothetical protein